MNASSTSRHKRQKHRWAEHHDAYRYTLDHSISPTFVLPYIFQGEAMMSKPWLTSYHCHRKDLAVAATIASSEWQAKSDHKMFESRLKEHTGVRQRLVFVSGSPTAPAMQPKEQERLRGGWAATTSPFKRGSTNDTTLFSQSGKRGECYDCQAKEN